MVLPKGSDKEAQLTKGDPEPLDVPRNEARIIKENSENLIVKEFFVNIFEDKPEQEQPKQAALKRVFVLPGIALIYLP